MALVSCGDSGARTGPQWERLDEIVDALRELDAERLSACFDTSDASGATAVARIRKGVALMVEGRELEARVRARFGDACARDTVAIAAPDRALQGFREGLSRGVLQVGDRSATLRLDERRPPLLFVQRAGRWLVSAPTLFGDDRNGEEQTDMLIRIAEEHLGSARKALEAARDEADFRARLEGIGRELRGRAAPVFRNLSSILWSRGY